MQIHVTLIPISSTDQPPPSPDPPEHIYHYTTGMKLRQIINSGQIKPTTAKIEAHEKPVAWFSTQDQWEPTVLAAAHGEPIDVAGYDLAPDAILTADARRLLAAVQASWVFGGMGSWNDVGFEGAEREIYLRSSQELHRALNEAVIVAANVCSPSRGGSPIL